jgi:cytochrome c oxidase assembly protein subunit 15
MSLEEFKYIFYWEYGHRVLGRLIGVMFALPFFYFLFAGKISPELKPKLWIALALGGMQGLMGWFMVKSGLVDEPLVSHFRLAAHLCLALIIFAYLSWLVMGQLQVSRLPVSTLFNRWLWGLAALLVLQIVYGAFVAGSRAGYGFNTYPLMNGQWLPEVALSHVPYWHNFFDNKAMLQFIHRWLGATLLVVAVIVAVLAFLRERPAIKLLAALLLAVIIGQFLLGILTLIYVVPVSLGSIHQAGACVVVLALMVLFYRTRATP